MLLAFCVIAPASIVYIAACLLLLPSRGLRILAGNVYGKLLGPTVFGLAGARLTTVNRERIRENAPALYVCNHTSTIDLWVSMWLSPWGCCGVAKKEIVRVPFFGQAYLLSGHVMVDRSAPEKAIASLERARSVVRRHRLSLWMWPEGTRSRDGRLLPLKKGFVHMAIATGLPVVPLVFHDADLRWPGRSFRASPGELRVEVLEPIDTSGWRAETAAEHARELWQRFQQALGPRQRGPEPSPPAGS